MHSVILLIGLITALGCFGPLAAPANAQQFPAKLVKFVVPQAPGGATDVFARKIGQILSEQWGQPIIIENRAGAGGVVGTDVVAKSAPDGYTLLVTYAGSRRSMPASIPSFPSTRSRIFKLLQLSPSLHSFSSFTQSFRPTTLRSSLRWRRPSPAL